MTAIHPDLVAVGGAAEVVSPGGYVLLGEAREVAAAGAAPEAEALLAALAGDLYSRVYVRPAGGTGAPADLLAERDHVAALSAANSGGGTWEPGWTAGAVDEDGRVAVTRDGLTFFAPPPEVRARRGAVRPGAPCRVWVGKERRNLLPGYYLAVGNAAPRDAAPLVRLYWHLTARAAVVYVAEATAALNSRDVPFRTKVLSDPGAYLRADAGVLYLERRHYRRLGDVLRALHLRLGPDLRPPTPLFARPLAPGLGLAEDPRDGMSFGQHRCRLAAQGLWRAFLQGDRTPEARAATLAATFREAGLNPAAPHLESGSRDRYTLRPPADAPAGDGGPARAARPRTRHARGHS
jgi:hypothetical protein